MDIEERKGKPRTHVKKRAGLDMWRKAMSKLKVTPTSGGAKTILLGW